MIRMVGSRCEIRIVVKKRKVIRVGIGGARVIKRAVAVLVKMMLGTVRIIKVRLRRCRCNMKMESYGCGAQVLGLAEDIRH